jgi:ADP-heptose:LPS heptosyltransferase
MKVDTMRKVDYFAGVPLCFFATLIRKIVDLFSARPAGKAKNVLLIELSEMGSTILADPAMRKLQRGGATLFFVIFKKNRPSLELLNTVAPENVYTIDEGGLYPLLRDTIGFLFWTRRNKIDAVLDLELFSRFTALLTGFSGAARRVAFHAFHNEGLYRGDMLTHKVAYNPHIHISKNFIALVNSLQSDKQELPFSKTYIADEEIRLARVTVTEEAKAAMRKKVAEVYRAFDANKDRIVLFNANASELLPIRKWPEQNYIAVGKSILKDYPRTIILLTGGKSEREGLETIKVAMESDRCVNFAAKTSLSELTALYSISACMLSNDSGPPHFASVTGMPTFVIFGPETPKLYCPLGNTTAITAELACSPCVSASNHRKTACTDNVCVQAIKPEKVLGLLKPVLDALH